MTKEQAEALATFVADHDTRFATTVVGDGDDCALELTEVPDGAHLDPVHTLDDYEARFITSNNPSPTIGEKWQSWRQQVA